MRIGFFTDSYLPTLHGVTISLEIFRKELERMGHEVWIFAPSFPGFRDPSPRVVRFPSVRVVNRPVIRLAFPFFGAARKYHVSPPLDIIHAHSPATMGFFGRTAARKRRVPLIYTHHTDIVSYARYYFFRDPFLIPRFAKRFMRQFAQSADAIIAPSPKVQRALNELGVTRPITVIPTGVDTSFFLPARIEQEKTRGLKKRYEIPENHKVLIFAGRLRKEKNIPFLVRAFQKIQRQRPSTSFLIVGDGPERKGLERLATALGIPHIVFAGPVTHDQMPSYYAMADMLILASRTETQGLIVLEALAMGLPVVALRDGAFEGILADGENGFLVPEQSEEQFAQRVLDLLNDDALFKRFVIAARKTAEEYNESNQAKKLVALYEKVLARRLSTSTAVEEVAAASS